MAAVDSIQIFVPFTIRKKNGRPKIMPPANYLPSEDQTQDPHILRAIGRAWGWRRRMDAGEFGTVAGPSAASAELGGMGIAVGALWGLTESVIAGSLSMLTGAAWGGRKRADALYLIKAADVVVTIHVTEAKDAAKLNKFAGIKKADASIAALRWLSGQA